MSESKPWCYGLPEQCLPRDENGVIQPQEACRRCEHLRACLQAAIAASGGPRKVRSNIAAGNKEKPGGVLGAVLRWSERKRAARRGNAG